MLRFMGWVWDAREPQQAEFARSLQRTLLARLNWQMALDTRGAQCFLTGGHPSAQYQVLPHGAGIVLGTLFEQRADPVDDSAYRPAIIEPRDIQPLLNSQGRRLIENYWGNYLAILCDEHRSGICIIKDPTGPLPCFITSLHGLTMLFSSVSDCLNLGAFSFTVNPAYLRDRVSGRHETSHGALNEVRPLYGGECLHFDFRTHPMTRTTRLHWHPLRLAYDTNPVEHPAQAAAMVRAAVRACTRTLAAEHDAVLLRLSGGLDSSIICACLADMPSRPTVTSYTYYDPHGPADERPWARLAAAHAAFEHLEYPFDPQTIDLRRRPKLLPSVYVVSILEYLDLSKLERQLTADRGATAIFSGDGGDSGFCSDSIALALVEYLKRHGLRSNALLLATQISLYTQRSSWQVLANSLRRWFRGQTPADQQEVQETINRLAHPDLRSRTAVDSTPVHPWFRDCDETPWALMRRLGNLPNPMPYYDLSADPDTKTPEVVAPLYAQPAVELFLRIPLYVHFFEGKDRGLARDAFAGMVPAPILQRLWKDRAPGFLEEIVSRNREALRELLLDGVLAASGLLDRSATEQALSPMPSKSLVVPIELFSHLDTELWARQWMDGRHEPGIAEP
ncbi:asparagine synthase [Steroidobacter denitrificans]|uniref:asparagine synthase (glutamine-hydrolyzing) n=1 Tax=Steroidobacter denitrificans TaxID=465721 RepID=A0A127FBS8_STEDE|nr:asparagine synthase-related protein [Steroidobacter denitrificans]AMN47866.1 asparagine synthase [Steroidobacter denitrificans]